MEEVRKSCLHAKGQGSPDQGQEPEVDVAAGPASGTVAAGAVTQLWPSCFVAIVKVPVDHGQKRQRSCQKRTLRTGSRATSNDGTPANLEALQCHCRGSSGHCSPCSESIHQGSAKPFQTTPTYPPLVRPRFPSLLAIPQPIDFTTPFKLCGEPMAIQCSALTNSKCA